MPQPERSFLLHERFWGQGYAQLSALNPYRWCGLAYAVFHSQTSASLTESLWQRVLPFTLCSTSCRNQRCRPELPVVHGCESTV